MYTFITYNYDYDYYLIVVYLYWVWLDEGPVVNVCERIDCGNLGGMQMKWNLYGCQLLSL